MAYFRFYRAAGAARFAVLQALLMTRKLTRLLRSRPLAAWTLAVAAALGGCAPVGPNFKTRLSPQAPRYTESPLAAQTASAATAAGSAQRYVPVSAKALRTAPVLLVDDMVDSRWTLTVAAWLLRSHGSGEVFPLALALTGHEK